MGAYLSQPIKKKNTKVGNNSQFQYCLSEMQGWRKSMETTCLCNVQLPGKNYLFAIFDGHGGCEVSQLVSEIFAKELTDTKQYKHGLYKQALQVVFKRIDDCISSREGQKRLLELRHKSGYSAYGTDEVISKQTGTTANVVLITKNKILIANIGNSRCLQIKKRDILSLSTDHTPQLQSESSRIQQAGGNITRGKINGELAVTRVLGDFIYKSKIQLPSEKQILICKPDVIQIDRIVEQNIIFMCCAGVWQKYGSDSIKLGRVVSQIIKVNQQGNNNLKTGLQNFFDHLIASDRKEKTGLQNMSGIIIKFG